MKRFFSKVSATVKDIAAHPDKYRKAAVVPVSAAVYLVSTYAGADSKTTLAVIALAASFGVYRVPNAA